MYHQGDVALLAFFLVPVSINILYLHYQHSVFCWGGNNNDSYTRVIFELSQVGLHWEVMHIVSSLIEQTPPAEEALKKVVKASDVQNKKM